MKDLFQKLILFYLFLLCSCKLSNVGKPLSSSLPFINTDWKLLFGKMNDSAMNFSLADDNTIIVRFDDKKFKEFDGSFIIKGTSKDTSSYFYIPTPYVGFYRVQKNNKIDLHWFSKISWSMGLNRSEISRILAKTFRFDGFYEFENNTLIFYKEDSGSYKRDTNIVMKVI